MRISKQFAKVLNSPFFLFVCSSIVLALISSYLQERHHIIKAEEAHESRISKIQTELYHQFRQLSLRNNLTFRESVDSRQWGEWLNALFLPFNSADQVFGSPVYPEYYNRTVMALVCDLSEIGDIRDVHASGLLLSVLEELRENYDDLLNRNINVEIKKNIISESGELIVIAFTFLPDPLINDLPLLHEHTDGHLYWWSIGEFDAK